MSNISDLRHFPGAESCTAWPGRPPSRPTCRRCYYEADPHNRLVMVGSQHSRSFSQIGGQGTRPLLCRHRHTTLWTSSCFIAAPTALLAHTTKTDQPAENDA